MSDRSYPAASGDVLIVDDFPDALVLYGAILTEDGHRVRTATSGVEALRKVDEHEPELVLLDVFHARARRSRSLTQAASAAGGRTFGRHADGRTRRTIRD